MNNIEKLKQNGKFKTKDLPLLKVEYVDITSFEDIEDLPNRINEFKKKLEIGSVAGWLIYEDEKVLMLVTHADMYHTKEDIMLIPKVCIVRRVPISEMG